MAGWPRIQPPEAVGSDRSVRSIRTGAPRHFHLLWDEDLDDLRPLLRAIIARRSEVVGEWYQLYVLHFAEDASLSEAEFRRIFEPTFLSNETALLDKDMDRYAENVSRLGETLAERHVPLRELIASLHLF